MPSLVTLSSYLIDQHQSSCHFEIEKTNLAPAEEGKKNEADKGSQKQRPSLSLELTGMAHKGRSRRLAGGRRASHGDRSGWLE